MQASVFVRPILPVCALVVLTLPAYGQLRLYDSNEDDLAKKTRSAFEEFSKGDNGLFDTMITNTLVMKDTTLVRLYALNQQKVRAKVNLVPEWTWNAFRDRVRESQDEFLGAYADARLILGDVTPPPANIEAALRDAQDRVTKLSSDKAAKETALNGNSGNRGEAAKLKDMQESLQQVRDGVIASTKPVRKLSDLEQFKNLKTVWEGVQGAKAWLDAAEKSTLAPGLQLAILDLALQRQQIEVDRLELELEHLTSQRNIADKMERQLRLVWGNGKPDQAGYLRSGEFGQIYLYLQPCVDSSECKGRHFFLTAKEQLDCQVIQTIGQLSKVANGEVGEPLDSTLQLRNLLDVLGRYLSIIGYQRYLLGAATMESVTDQQIYSIRLSALNTRERAALIGHGLDGLAAYYAGGIKPEDVANIMRAAETAASAVIAGRIN